MSFRTPSPPSIGSAYQGYLQPLELSPPYLSKQQQAAVATMPFFALETIAKQNESNTETARKLAALKATSTSQVGKPLPPTVLQAIQPKSTPKRVAPKPKTQQEIHLEALEADNEKRQHAFKLAQNSYTQALQIIITINDTTVKIKALNDLAQVYILRVFKSHVVNNTSNLIDLMANSLILNEDLINAGLLMEACPQAYQNRNYFIVEIAKKHIELMPKTNIAFSSCYQMISLVENSFESICAIIQCLIEHNYMKETLQVIPFLESKPLASFRAQQSLQLKVLGASVATASAASVQPPHISHVSAETAMHVE